MPDVSVRLIIDAFSVLGALFAIWKGGVAERAAAAVVIANVVIGLSGKWLAPGLNEQIRLVNDGLTALILLGITVRYGALWMGGAMLFYAAQFALHSFYLVTERPTDYLYAPGLMAEMAIGPDGVIWFTWRRNSGPSRLVRFTPSSPQPVPVAALVPAVPVITPTFTG